MAALWDQFQQRQKQKEKQDIFDPTTEDLLSRRADEAV